MGQHFRAPWSAKLKVTTAVFTLICVAAMIAINGWGSLLILAILLGSLALTVRGYSVHQGKLLIHRLGWATQFDLDTLSTVEASPGVTVGSVRTMGIGGLFGFVGHYRNAVLGSYKAFATDADNAVVLDFSGETIVVTPDDPVAFVESVEDARSWQAVGEENKVNGLVS